MIRIVIATATFLATCAITLANIGAAEPRTPAGSPSKETGEKKDRFEVLLVLPDGRQVV